MTQYPRGPFKRPKRRLRRILRAVPTGLSDLAALKMLDDILSERRPW